MLKVWGLIMIIVATAMIGWQLSMNLKKRIRLLENIKFIFEEIANEVCFGKDILPDVLRHVCNKTDGISNIWLWDLMQRIGDVGEKSFANAWKESLETLKTSELLPDDIKLFEKLGFQIVNLNEERLNIIILSYVKMLDERIDVLKKDYVVKSKLYKSLGILSGIFIIIIVI